MPKILVGTLYVMRGLLKERNLSKLGGELNIFMLYTRFKNQTLVPTRNTESESLFSLFGSEASIIGV